MVVDEHVPPAQFFWAISRLSLPRRTMLKEQRSGEERGGGCWVKKIYVNSISRRGKRSGSEWWHLTEFI